MNVRPVPSVLWREGMFMCPQHLQAFARELGARIAAGDASGRVGSYGLVALEIDEEALEREVFIVKRAAVVMRDGTYASFPETAEVAPRDFEEHFTASTLPVYLGFPSPQENVPQLEDGGEQARRYSALPVHVYDENLRDAGCEIEVRQLRGRLFFGAEDRTGYECLPIATLVRRGKPVAVSALSETFVPPALACSASPALRAMLGEAAEKLRAQARDLASCLPATESLSSVEKGADLAGFVKLQAVNQSLAEVEQVARVPDVHPFDAYVALTRTVGNLAIFGVDRVCPVLPPYEHERLETCFGAALAALRDLLIAEVSVPYDTLAFTKDPLREGFYEIELPREWLEADPIYYLGVELARRPEEVTELVAGGAKLVPPSDIERVLQGVVPGIQLLYQRTPPLSFPKRPDLHYFRVQTEGSSRDSWLRVLENRSAVLLSALGALDEVRFHFYVELA